MRSAQIQLTKSLRAAFSNCECQFMRKGGRIAIFNELSHNAEYKDSIDYIISRVRISSAGAYLRAGAHSAAGPICCAQSFFGRAFSGQAPMRHAASRLLGFCFEHGFGRVSFGSPRGVTHPPTDREAVR